MKKTIIMFLVSIMILATFGMAQGMVSGKHLIGSFNFNNQNYFLIVIKQETIVRYYTIAVAQGGWEMPEPSLIALAAVDDHDQTGDPKALLTQKLTTLNDGLKKVFGSQSPPVTWIEKLEEAIMGLKVIQENGIPQVK